MSESDRQILSRYLMDQNQPSSISDLSAQPSLVRDQAALEYATKVFDAQGELDKVGAIVATVGPGEAVEITFNQFDYGGYGKGATHRLTIQRASDTEVPSEVLPTGGALHGDELVAIFNGNFIWLEWSDPTTPSALLHFYQFQKNGQEVKMPLFIVLPAADFLRQKTNAVIVATRYPKASISVEKSGTLLFPKGGISPDDSNAL